MLKRTVFCAVTALVAMGQMTAAQAASEYKETPVNAGLRQKCSAGEAKACFTLGAKMTSYADKWDEAKTLLEKSCSLKEGKACGLLGAMHEDAVFGVRRDPKLAADFYVKGCDFGDMWSCSSLGKLYTRGKGVEKDYDKAVAFLDKGCKMGDGEACGRLGTLFYNGKGVAKDDKRAVDYYQLACDAKDGNGCLMMGRLYEAGQAGIKMNITVAKDYYDLSCQCGSADGCAEYDRVIQTR